MRRRLARISWRNIVHEISDCEEVDPRTLRRPTPDTGARLKS